MLENAVAAEQELVACFGGTSDDIGHTADFLLLGSEVAVAFETPVAYDPDIQRRSQYSDTVDMNPPRTRRQCWYLPIALETARFPSCSQDGPLVNVGWIAAMYD